MYIGGRWLSSITTFELNLIPGFYDCLLRLQLISNTNHVQIIVKPSLLGICYQWFCLASSNYFTVPLPFPPSSFQVVESDVGGLHKKFCDGCTPKAPLSGTHPETFFNDKKMEPIYCNCPSNTPDTIPVTLLHPIFGQFMDNCEKHSPMADDYAVRGQVMLGL